MLLERAQTEKPAQTKLYSHSFQLLGMCIVLEMTIKIYIVKLNLMIPYVEIHSLYFYNVPQITY